MHHLGKVNHKAFCWIVHKFTLLFEQIIKHLINILWMDQEHPHHYWNTSLFLTENVTASDLPDPMIMMEISNLKVEVLPRVCIWVIFSFNANSLKINQWIQWISPFWSLLFTLNLTGLDVTFLHHFAIFLSLSLSSSPFFLLLAD